MAGKADRHSRRRTHCSYCARYTKSRTAEYEYSLEGDELVSIFKSGTSYLIPIDLETGMPDTTQAKQVTGLPEREIIYAYRNRPELQHAVDILLGCD